MESIWSKTVQSENIEHDIFSDASIQKETIQTEIAVIGAGMAGILTAHLLQEAGLRVVVLEAAKIASGQTKNTTAKITSQHNLIYHKLIEAHGEEKARQYANANETAIKQYKELIEKYQIECHFEECPAYLYFHNNDKSNQDPLISDEKLQEERNLNQQKKIKMLKDEVEAAKKLGITAELIMESDMFPFPILGAVKFSHQAQFHPLEFINKIAASLTVYEDTKVIEVEENRIVTERGTVLAKHIVFATHFPFINMPGYYFMRMHQERSYVIALENVPAIHGMYLGLDKEHAYSLRSFEANKDILLLGGGSHRTGENSVGGKYDMLIQVAKRYWPKSNIIAKWSAQDCMTLDNIPYIGRYATDRPNWYVATGFGKWGMTSSMVSARVITDFILEKETSYAEVFSPQRFQMSADGKNMMKEGIQAVKGLWKENFKLPNTEVDKLPSSHGGIVEYDGEKVGVYKNEQGEAFFVTTRCPHLGCQLEWNPDELSWDCPCHGSRFDFKGHLIDNPAQEDILYE